MGGTGEAGVMQGRTAGRRFNGGGKLNGPSMTPRTHLRRPRPLHGGPQGVVGYQDGPGGGAP